MNKMKVQVYKTLTVIWLAITLASVVGDGIFLRNRNVFITIGRTALTRSETLGIVFWIFFLLALASAIAWYRATPHVNNVTPFPSGPRTTRGEREE